jgi:hypothetical protein
MWHHPAMGLQLQDQVELTKLEYPSLAPCYHVHAPQIVDGKRTDSPVGLRRNIRKGLFPSDGGFFTRQEDWIQEQCFLAFTRLERDEV